MIIKILLFIRHPFLSIGKVKVHLNSVVTRILWQITIPFAFNSEESVHVDLGSGNFPRNPFGASKIIGTDFHSDFNSLDGVEFLKVDLTRALPFPDSSISSMSAYDVLEHIPRWERIGDKFDFPFISLMNEIYRCLKPGGLFLAVTPAFPSQVSFQDPTHVNFISVNTVGYFTGPSPFAKVLGYGFTGQFHLECQSWIIGPPTIDGLKSENLGLDNKIKILKFILSPKNIGKLFKIFKINLVEEKSHLLWVLSKPHESD